MSLNRAVGKEQFVNTRVNFSSENLCDGGPWNEKKNQVIIRNDGIKVCVNVSVNV